jgi:hypothetical protein
MKQVNLGEFSSNKIEDKAYKEQILIEDKVKKLLDNKDQTLNELLDRLSSINEFDVIVYTYLVTYVKGGGTCVNTLNNCGCDISYSIQCYLHKMLEVFNLPYPQWKYL